MSDINDEIKRETNELDAPKQLQLHIVMDVRGNLKIQGTLDKPLYLIYGVLESAKDAIRRHFEKANAPRVVEAGFQDLPPMGRKS